MNAEPKLAPPGAGISFLNKLVLRLVVGPFVAARSDWDQNFKNFKKVNLRILEQLEGLSEAELETKILVPPQRGLEDSSRYWSIAMTLEHLCIVTSGMKEVIVSLSKGIVLPGEANTALVKPQGKKELKVVLSEFKHLCESVVGEIESQVKDKNSQAKYKHPWFGFCTLRQWQWILAAHHGIHYQQIKAIKAGLLKSKL